MKYVLAMVMLCTSAPLIANERCAKPHANRIETARAQAVKPNARRVEIVRQKASQLLAWQRAILFEPQIL